MRLRATDATFAAGGTYAVVVGPPLGTLDRTVGLGYDCGAFEAARHVAPGHLPLRLEHGGQRIGTLVGLKELRDALWTAWRVDDPRWTWLLDEHPEVSFTLAKGSRSRREGGVRVIEDAVLLDASVVPLWGGVWGERCRIAELSWTLSALSAVEPTPHPERTRPPVERTTSARHAGADAFRRTPTAHGWRYSAPHEGVLGLR